MYPSCLGAKNPVCLTKSYHDVLRVCAFDLDEEYRLSISHMLHC